jgi:hypothetical protein
MYILCSGFELYNNILKSNLRNTNNECYISYSREGDYVMLEWLKPPVSGGYRKKMEEGLLKLKETKAKSLVRVVRMLGVLDPEDIGWEDDVWFPQVLALGLDKIAIVTNESLYNRQVLERLSGKERSHNFNLCYFTDLSKAILWIKS